MADSKPTIPEVTERLKPWNSIRGRLAILTIVLMGIISVFIQLFFPSQQKHQAEGAAAITAQTVADMTAHALAEPLRMRRIETVNSLVDATMKLPDVVYVYVLDADGKILTQDPPQPDTHGVDDVIESAPGFADSRKLFRVRRSIVEDDGEHLAGTLYLGYSLSDLDESIRQSRSIIMYISLLVFVFGLAGVYAISYVITEPLGQMVRAAQRVSAGDFGARVVSASGDEVGLLARTFNHMVDNLQAAYASLENANATLAHHSEDLQQEVSSRASVEKALRLSEGRFRAVVEYATDVVLIVSNQGETAYVSPPCKAMLGYEPEDLIGTDFGSIVHPADRDEFRGAFSGSPGKRNGKAGETGVISIEVRCRHRSGAWRYLALRGRTLADQPGIEGTLFNVSDISELKRYQQQLVNARDTAEKMVRLKDSFLANMSHEIRTPLTGILGFAQVLRQEVGQEHMELVRYIQEGGTRLLNTLNSVLDLAQLEANALDMQLEVVNLGHELADTVRLLEPLAQVKQLSLKVVEGNMPVYTEVDKRCLYRIINNLLTNAIKFTERGGVFATVRPEGDMAILEVRDTGVGVSPDFLPHLFDEFKQESTGLSRTHEGSGLGLAITRRLVELHGGTISAKSEKGAGSTFIVSLPLATPTRYKPSKRRFTPADREPSEASRYARILLVEDNADTRLLFQRILSASYDLTIAATPSEALQIGRMESFELVIMDISLGEELDGVQVMSELRTTGRFDGVPFLAVTAYALPGDRLEFLSQGFQDYLAKPFRKEDLLEMVRRHLTSAPTRVVD